MSEPHEPTAIEIVTAAWAAFDAWLVQWRETHPDDERSDLELIPLYYEENKRGEAFDSDDYRHYVLSQDPEY